MSQRKQSRVFRVSEVPECWTQDDLKLALQQHGLAIDSPECRLSSSPFAKGTCTAILFLDSTASVLKPILDNPLSDCLLPFKGSSLVIDQHFLGLTVVASPRSSDIKAEYFTLPVLSES
jgi:hypothetical protein